MSFLKRLRRKVGGRQSEHGEGADGDLQEGADETEARKSQELGTNEADDIRTGVVPQAGPDKGQIVNISGGTFSEIQNQTNIQYVMSDESESKLFAMLNPVAAAHDCQEVASKVKECFAGTRCQLLLDMENWRANESSVPIFILDGIAGIGKTTVVKTFCTRAASEHRLAASWFFSRDRQDRKSTRRFVGTLAYQLALYHPAFGDRVAHALKDHPDILQKTIRAQFDTLIHEPLEAVLKELDGTHAISIDAIDECDLDEATEILSILLGTVPKHPQLRFLISCRPERPFRLLLQRHRGPHVFHLHEIENSVVESDIRLYIDYRLSPEQVDDALPDLLPPPWRASAKEKEALVQMAGKLFIIASTAVNFILDPRRLAPARQMRQLLDATTGSALASSPMDRLYTQVLRAAVPDPVDDWFDDYQAVVGAIVVAADVLPVQSLASLLGKEPNSIVGTLSHLHALVAPTSQNHNEAFRVHHKSFPDFVTDPTRCSIDTRFLIDASACHAHLARGCLRVMVQMLKQNICELPFLDWSKRLNELPPGIVDRIPPELAYACTHWVSHFQQGLSHFSGSKDTLFCDQLNTFVNEHLLSWLEVMAFTGRFNTAWESVNVLSEAILLFLQTATGSTLATLSHVAHVLQDCLHFINLHPDLPRLCPMHIYLSSLPFAPIGSPMGRLYAKCKCKEPVNAVLGVDWNWDSLAVVIESYNTVDLRFSPCGAMIAILTHSLALYDAKSGVLIRRFYSPEIPLPRFCCLAFSADGHLVVVGSATRAYVWKVASGELIAKFLVPVTTREASDNDDGNEGEGEDGNSDDQVPMTSIAFTGDCASIVAGREDGVLFLWSLEGSEVPQHVVHTRKLNEACGCPSDGFLETCEVHHVEDLIALPNPLSIISVTGSDVQFWDPSPPDSLINIPRHVHGTRPCPVSLPLNKTMLAIQSNPCAIDIYSTSRPRCIAVLSGHRGLVTTTAFSPEGENLCSASEDMTVRLWNVPTATQLRIIPTTPSILSDAIFAKPVGTIFRNADRMVMLTGIECTPFGTTTTRGYSNHLVRLSPGGSTIAIHTFPFTIFSSLNELTASSSDFNDFPYMTGFFPTGELVTRWNKEPGFVEVVITELKGGTQVASASFKIKGSSFITSPDKTRMAVIGASSSVSVYNLHSKNLEASLTPLPEDTQRGEPWVYFSWDSQTVYVERQDSELSHDFYAAILQPPTLKSQTCSNELPSVIPFTKYGQSPDPSWRYLRRRTFYSSQVEEFTGSVQHPHSWTHVEPASLPTYITTIAYSPDGLRVVVVDETHEGNRFPSRKIQMRSLPDYSLVRTLKGNRHGHGIQVQFLPSLPHISVAHSQHKGLTSWNTLTWEIVGDYAFDGVRCIHPYNASDFLCLVDVYHWLSLTAVQLRGALPAKVCHICWFPPHLLMKSDCLEVNPCLPHIIALKGRSGPLLVDISKFPLPFNL